MLLLPHEKWLIRTTGSDANNRIQNRTRLQLLKDHGPTGLNCIIAGTSDGAIGATLFLIGLIIAVVWSASPGLVTIGFTIIGISVLFMLLTLLRVLQAYRGRPT